MRDKEAYFISWNVVKVFFNNPRREQLVSGENPMGDTKSKNFVANFFMLSTAAPPCLSELLQKCCTILVEALAAVHKLLEGALID